MNRAIELSTYDGTFRKSRNLPFHRWYPYLEGFGERFVEEIIGEYADNSSYLIDPFAGCGTALLVSSQRGLNSGYFEINPFLRLVIETKVNVPIRLLEKGITIQKELGKFIEYCKELEALDLPLTEPPPLFIDKPYFEKNVLRTILKLKSAIYQHLGRDDDLRNLGLLALGGILVDVSKLKRAGDLRYRRPKELPLKSPNVIELFTNRLQHIIADCSLQDKRPIAYTDFLGQDARKIDSIKSEADLIVTSPPYLNGTNYVRNTKLELWLLDYLKSQDEMAQLRKVSISAGINDVTVSKMVLDLPKYVEDVATKLENVSYDSRIPLLIRQYFSDMKICLESLARYTRTGGLLFLDIGDSVFCGVHVPTHIFLEKIAQEVGFHFEDSYTIRSRRSRGGGSVGQYLLRFRKESNVLSAPILSKYEHMSDRKIRNRINKFQDMLPYQQSPYNKRNWGHRYHSLCSFQSKLKPAIAHFLISWFTQLNQNILDPFGGVGTIPFEAKLSGRPNMMSDLSPAAFIVAKGKLEPVSQSDSIQSYESLISFIKKNRSEMNTEQYAQFGLNRKLEEYYHSETFKEILAARVWLQKRIKKITAPEAFVTGCLLHLLHGNRPYALSRRSHPLTPFAPSGSFEYRPIENRLLKKILRACGGVGCVGGGRGGGGGFHHRLRRGL